MIKKTITYVDFNGVEREEDFYFNLSRVEAARMQAEWYPETPEEYMNRIAREGSTEDHLSLMEKLVLASYGRKSKDGRSFIKDPEYTRAFEYSEAYGELFVELLTNPQAVTAFAQGIGAMVDKTSKAVEIPEGFEVMRKE